MILALEIPRKNASADLAESERGSRWAKTRVQFMDRGAAVWISRMRLHASRAIPFVPIPVMRSVLCISPGTLAQKLEVGVVAKGQRCSKCGASSIVGPHRSLASVRPVRHLPTCHLGWAGGQS